MSPLLRDVKEEINNQARSQTSEQDEATFGCRRLKAKVKRQLPRLASC